MGLDMFLEKEIYIYESDRSKISIKGLPDKAHYKFDITKIRSLILSVATWRKANQIHKWFVDNVQDGVDDCKRYYVHADQLIRLEELCQIVLKGKNKSKRIILAKEVLPTKEGFFFGTTEYDEYYFEDLKNTIKQLKDIDPNADYYYQSSW